MLKYRIEYNISKEKNMKRIVSLLLTLIMVMSLCSTVVFAENLIDSVVTVQNSEGFASQLVSVTVRADEISGLSGASIKIKYDTKLELISVENGGFFDNIADSAIYGQDTAGVNGEYTYVGLNNGENSPKVRGELVKLSFKLPSDAQAGDKYQVEVVKNGSILATGVDSSKEFRVVNGEITVKEGTPCASHTFGDYVVLGTSSYLSNGYKYRVCTACNVTETEYVPATAINVFEYIGTSINYTGKPSGIAPMFKVDMNMLNLVYAQNIKCKVDAGIVVYKDGKVYDEEVFFGDGATYQLVNDTLFIKVNDVSAYDEFTFKAYVKITDEETKEERIAYTTATVNGSEEISICDVAKRLDLKSYSKENRVYLQNILDGFAD